MGKRVTLIFLLCLIIGATSQYHLEKPVETAFVRNSIQLSFVGDLMAHVENLRSRPFSEAFVYVAHALDDVDLTFANFEFVVDPTKPAAGYPRFNAPAAYAEAAILAGVDVVSLANNHSFDLGIDGVNQTAASMKRFADLYEIAYSGINADTIVDAGPPVLSVLSTESVPRFKITSFESNGFSVGFLAVTSFINRLIRTEYVNIADYNRTADREALLHTIRAARGEYDIFVLSYHGGVEYSTEPATRKTSLFTECIDAGVDIVWGHHPHVMQEWGRYTGSVRSGFIMHSLGNFLSGQSSYVDTANPNDRRALRGESVIITLEIAEIDVDASRRPIEGVGEPDTANEPESAYASGIEILSIDVVPIVHFPDANRIVRVATIDKIDDIEVAPEWSLFLEKRQKYLADYLESHDAVASLR